MKQSWLIFTLYWSILYPFSQASPSFILAWCAGWSCCSSLSQWSIGCALVTLTHTFMLRLPHALMTTLWGFGAYNVVLGKRNQYPGKPTWWAGSLRRNQKSNMEQVRPLSWGTLLCNTAAEFCLFSVPTKAFGLSYKPSEVFVILGNYSYTQTSISTCKYFCHQQDKLAEVAYKYGKVCMARLQSRYSLTQLAGQPDLEWVSAGFDITEQPKEMSL